MKANFLNLQPKTELFQKTISNHLMLFQNKNWQKVDTLKIEKQSMAGKQAFNYFAQELTVFIIFQIHSCHDTAVTSQTPVALQHPSNNISSNS